MRVEPAWPAPGSPQITGLFPMLALSPRPNRSRSAPPLRQPGNELGISVCVRRYRTKDAAWAVDLRNSLAAKADHVLWDEYPPPGRAVVLHLVTERRSDGRCGRNAGERPEVAMPGQREGPYMDIRFARTTSHSASQVGHDVIRAL